MNRLATGLAGFALVLIGLGQTSARADYASTVLADNPLGYWRFGEASGPVAYDASPNHLDGDYIGGVTPGQPGAVLTDSDTSAWFNGTTGYVDVGVHPTLNQLFNDISIELWLSPDNVAGIDTILSTRELVGGSGGYALWRDGGVVGFNPWGVLGGGGHTSTDVLVAGQWKHVVVVFDKFNDTSFYIDGQFVEKVAGTGPIDPNNQPLYIGRAVAAWGSLEYWDGGIDELAIYGRALDAGEIREHYLAAVPEPSALVALLGMGIVSLLGCTLRKRRQDA